MTRDTVSLLLVNGASAMLLGTSFVLAVDVVPWLRQRRHWVALVLVVAVWAAAIVGADALPFPMNLQARRTVGACVSLWVVYLLVRYASAHRDEEEGE